MQKILYYAGYVLWGISILVFFSPDIFGGGWFWLWIVLAILALLCFLVFIYLARRKKFPQQ